VVGLVEGERRLAGGLGTFAPLALGATMFTIAALLESE
jgi:hypothetical protein